MLSECCTFCCGFHQNMSRASSLCYLFKKKKTDRFFVSNYFDFFFNNCIFWASLRILHEAVIERSPSITIQGFPR